MHKNNKNILSKILFAYIILIIFGGLLISLGIYDVYVISPDHKLIKSSFIFIGVILFLLAFLLSIIKNIIAGLPWHGYINKLSPEEVEKENESLQDLIKNAEKLDKYKKW